MDDTTNTNEETVTSPACTEDATRGMKAEGIWRFDASALYTALDTQRQARGMSWQQVAAEVGVSVSTLTRTRLGGRMEADGMLAMVRWLGRTAESFTRVVGRTRASQR